MSKLRRVAVIGIGASGVSALRHLSQYPDAFEPVGFEKNREVGGLWNFSDYTDTDEYGLPCYASLYKQLRINLPNCAMAFPDRPYPEGLPSFVTHKDVKDYLDDYCKVFDLNKYCRFQTLIMKVVPKRSDDDMVWLVTSRNLVNDEVVTEVFDNVILSNGKEGVPLIPDLPGLDTFKGLTIHTKNLRDLSKYEGKTILLIGASYSAQDIIFEMAPIIPKMYLCHRRKGPLPFEKPDNVYDEESGVREILPNGVILENGECREVDMIIFATGYRYSFPFLSDEVNLTIKDERIQPIYKQMIHIEYPSLCFLGLLKAVLKFQCAQLQACYICHVLLGKIKLPTKREMYKDEEEDFQKRVIMTGRHPRFAHDLFHGLQDYITGLQTEMERVIILPGMLKLWDAYAYAIDYEFGTLKQRTFRLIGEDDFEMIL